MSDEEIRGGEELPVEPILVPEEGFVPAGGPPVARAILVAPRRPRVWTVFVLYFLVIMALVAVNVVLILALALVFHGPTFRSPADFTEAVTDVSFSSVGVIVTVLCNGCLLAGASIAAGLLSPVPLRDRLRVKPAWLSPGVLLVSIVGTLAVSMIFTGLDGLGWLPESPMLEGFSDVVGNMSGLTLAVAALVIGLGPGIGEELLFRGYMQTRLCRRWGAGPAIFVTSVLFGIMHFDLVQGTFAVGVGFFLGYLTERTGSILPAMVCHTVNNMLSTVEAGFGGLPIEGPAANGLAVAGSVLLVALAVVYLHCRVTPAEAEPVGAGSAMMR